MVAGKRSQKWRQAAARASQMQGLGALWCFYKGMHYCLWQKGNYAGLSVVSPSKQARLQIYWLALSIRIWDEPHYRSGTFQNDLRKNLRNVAVPKTGIPLSWFCHSKILATVFVLIVFPLLCLAAAIVRLFPGPQLWRPTEADACPSEIRHIPGMISIQYSNTELSRTVLKAILKFNFWI